MPVSSPPKKRPQAAGARTRAKVLSLHKNERNPQSSSTAERTTSASDSASTSSAPSSYANASAPGKNRNSSDAGLPHVASWSGAYPSGVSTINSLPQFGAGAINSHSNPVMTTFVGVGAHLANPFPTIPMTKSISIAAANTHKQTGLLKASAKSQSSPSLDVQTSFSAHTSRLPASICEQKLRYQKARDFLRDDVYTTSERALDTTPPGPSRPIPRAALPDYVPPVDLCLVNEAEGLPQLQVLEHHITVPLCHLGLFPRASVPAGAPETIDLFVREMFCRGRPRDRLPPLLYLEGGPGFQAPRPIARYGWLARATEEFRVFLLDQRGCGLSTVLQASHLMQFSPEDQVKLLSFFRADSIVEDCELVRKKLVGGSTKWTILGQSFGGFVAMRYLSARPQGLETCLFAGGIPPVGHSARDVYRATFCRVISRNQKFFERYPSDQERMKNVVRVLNHQPIILQDGSQYTSRRFLLLGLRLGAEHSFESLHYLLEHALVPRQFGRKRDECCVEDLTLSQHFMNELPQWEPHETQPLYALLHESIYAEETSTGFAAEEVLAEFPPYWDTGLRNSKYPLYFFGEMMFPFMYQDFAKLSKLKETADLLTNQVWPALYDQKMLRENTVPCAAAVYYNDMYVDHVYQEETASMMPNFKCWVERKFNFASKVS